MSPLRFIAVDLGGTQIRAARYTSEGVQEARVAMPTGAPDGLEPVFQRIRSAVRQVWPLEGTVAAIGMGVPGPLDYRRGVIRFAPNLPGWVDIPIRDMMLQTFGIPVFVGNDADVAGLAEHRFGAGRGVQNMIYMTISTGIGGGFILGNKLFVGGHGSGGEVGHIAVDLHNPHREQGNTGTLEELAAGPAIAYRARLRLEAGEPSLLRELVNGDLERITAKEVNEAAQQGDALARAIFTEAGMYIGAAIVNLIYLLDPGLFVLGGSVTQAGDLLFGPIWETVKLRAPATYLEYTRIVPAQLGADVGLWGALALALMELNL